MKPGATARRVNYKRFFKGAVEFEAAPHKNEREEKRKNGELVGEKESSCCRIFVLLLATPAWAQDTVTIVMLDPLSGPMKSIGDMSVWGVQFAVDEINAAGGLLGKKVKLMPEDSQLKPDVAARKATKAIMTDGAQFIFQLTSTAIAQALMDVAEKNKVIYVNFGAESDFLTGEKLQQIFFPHLLYHHQPRPRVRGIFQDEALAEVLSYESGLCLRSCRGG